MRQMTAIMIGDALHIYYSDLGFETEQEVKSFAKLLDPDNSEIKRIWVFVDGGLSATYSTEE